jgi:hypothetical protein
MMQGSSIAYANHYLHKSKNAAIAGCFLPLLLTQEGGEGRGGHEARTWVTLFAARTNDLNKNNQVSISSPKPINGSCLWDLVMKLKPGNKSFLHESTSKTEMESVTHVLASCREEAVLLGFLSLRLSPRSFLAGRERTCLDTNG